MKSKSNSERIREEKEIWAYQGNRKLTYTENKSLVFRKSNKTDKPLATLIKEEKKRENIEIANMNEKTTSEQSIRHLWNKRIVYTT